MDASWVCRKLRSQGSTLSDTAGGPGLFQGPASSFSAIEAHLPREKILQIKRHLNGAFELMCGDRFDPVIAAAIAEHGGLVDALRAKYSGKTGE